MDHRYVKIFQFGHVELILQDVLPFCSLSKFSNFCIVFLTQIWFVLEFTCVDSVSTGCYTMPDTSSMVPRTQCVWNGRGGPKCVRDGMAVQMRWNEMRMRMVMCVCECKCLN